MSDTAKLADDEARRVIREDLDSTLYVEAGAGTGKTTSLVNRIVAIILSGRAGIQDIAAITFTEAAASELKDRIRESLEKYSSGNDISEEKQTQVLDALTNMDSATIQTLHSFAGTLIRQFPLEAGISPGFEILDDFEDEAIFDQFWETWLDSSLGDDATVPMFKALISLGVPLERLGGVAHSFWENYDLLTYSDFSDTAKAESINGQMLLETVEQLTKLLPLSINGQDDPLYSHVVVLLDVLRLIIASLHSEYSALYLLGNCSTVGGDNRRPYQRISNSRLGRQRDWDTDPVTGDNGCKLIKAILSDLEQLIENFVIDTAKHALMPILRDLQTSVISRAGQRKIDGRLTFHDLLVYARNMLRDDLDVRDHYRDLYKYVLIDEFQDTDPIQAEIATLLCEDKPVNGSLSERSKNWQHIPTLSGKLFAVGDPKQSIFRFRRADVAVANTIKESIADRILYLTTNFRSREPIIRWVNRVFAEVIIESNEQPAYIPLDLPNDETDQDSSPKVKFFGNAIDERMDVVRSAEARELARILKRIIAEAWTVRDMDEVASQDAPELRPIRYDDICILSPTRSPLSSILNELDNAQIPYRLESAFMMYATEEVRDLIQCLRAIDNPRDYVSVVATLRSPVFGCTDADIFSHVSSGKSLNSLETDGNVQSHVGASLALLKEFYFKKAVLPVTRLIEEVVRARALIGFALTKSRFREQWRKYQLIIDKARVLSENRPLTLGFFIEWIDKQISSGVRSLDSAVPDSDENAVRIMTMHRSKGLEFPLVVVVGIGGNFSQHSDAVLFDRDSGQAEVRVTGGLSTKGWSELSKSEDVQFVNERKRLLYVACTRARDYLLISAYRRPNSGQVRWLIDALGEQGQEGYWDEITGTDLELPGIPSPPHLENLPEPITKEALQSWEESHEQSFARSRNPASITATQLVTELKEEHSSDDEPWKRGRAGTSIGRAVHAILQNIELSPDVDVQPLSKVEATAEGIPQYEETITRLVKNALHSDVLARAIHSGKMWREVPVMAPIGDQTIEGIIDLIFEEDSKLVIVDYKTDSLNSKEEIEQAISRYRIQGAVYAYAAAKATGKQVKEVVLLFLNPNVESILKEPDKMAFEVEEAISKH